jgi:hypothetical protein
MDGRGGCICLELEVGERINIGGIEAPVILALLVGINHLMWLWGGGR